MTEDTSERDDAGPLPTVVGVAGPSGSGKTTLVERLVEAFAADGARVATAKSIHHAIEPDEPGTDTYRHRTAGAAAAVGITPRHAFEIRPHDPDRKPGGEGCDPNEAAPDADGRKRTALAEAVGRFAAAGHDLVIVEGFADVPIPTVRLGGVDAGAGETIADDDDPFDAVVAAVRAADPPASLGRLKATAARSDATEAEPNADDGRDR